MYKCWLEIGHIITLATVFCLFHSNDASKRRANLVNLNIFRTKKLRMPILFMDDVKTYLLLSSATIVLRFGKWRSNISCDKEFKIMDN